MIKDFGLLSIIVPVYNSEKWLKRCIDSILNQTYKNFELILINDGSTDRSPIILEEYAKKDHRIRVFHQNNRGQGVTRKRGIDYSIGKFIAFVDNDDYIRPRMYETMINLINENNVDICVCLWNYETENGYQSVNPQSYASKASILGKHHSTKFAHYIYKETPYEYGIVTAPWNKVFKKHTLKDVNFSGKRGEEEEEEMMDAILSRDYYIYVDKNDFYVWCFHKSSMSHSKFTLDWLHTLDVYQKRTSLYSPDSFMIYHTEQRFCDLCIEYYYETLAIQKKFPTRYKSMMLKSIWHLLFNKHKCGGKFYIRCLLFLISPILYKQIVKSKNKNAFK